MTHRKWMRTALQKEPIIVYTVSSQCIKISKQKTREINYKSIFQNLLFFQYLKNPWNCFISFDEFFVMDFFNFSGPLCNAVLTLCTLDDVCCQMTHHKNLRYFIEKRVILTMTFGRKIKEKPNLFYTKCEKLLLNFLFFHASNFPTLEKTMFKKVANWTFQFNISL